MLDLRISKLGDVISVTLSNDPQTNIGTFIFDNYQAQVAIVQPNFQRQGHYTSVIKCVRIFARRSIRSSAITLMSEGARGAWRKADARVVVCYDSVSYYEL